MAALAVGPSRPITAALGKGNLGTLDAGRHYTLVELKALLEQPARSSVDHQAFLEMSKAKRDELKQKDRFVLFGTCRDGKRDDEHLVSRSALSLDFDRNAATLFFDLDCGKSYGDFAFIWHTTRSHATTAPRLRIFIPLSRDVTPAEYRPLCTTVAAHFDSTLDAASVKPAQMMFLPVQNAGADFLCGSSDGDGYLNPDFYLAQSAPVESRAVTIDIRTDSTDPLEFKQPDPRWTFERVRDELMPFIYEPTDPFWTRDNWLKLGMILDHQGAGGDEWLELWDEHSSRDDRTDESGAPFYIPEQCAERWAGFRSGRKNAAGIGTLLKWAEVGRAKAGNGVASRLISLRFAIETADRDALVGTVARQIRETLNLSALDRAELVGEVQKRLKEMTGTKPPIKEVRELLAPDVSPLLDGAPKWAHSWVYVASGDAFFDLEKKIAISKAAFNAKYDRLMPWKDDSGMPLVSASDAALKLWGMSVVDRIGYFPRESAVFEWEGLTYANSYNDSQIPTMPPVLLPDEEQAVEILRAHLANLFDDERERGLFESWLAFVVQNPGVKVRWVPYLCGPEGDGKSFFVRLLRVIMGAANVKPLDGAEITGGSSFSDWAVNRCVTGIEEVKMHGHNKFDAANRIKPFLTNDTISVHPKHSASYDAPNTVQYLIMSNFMDGVPITDSDRRFCFLRTRFSVASLLGFMESDPSYFARLHAALDQFPGALRYWLTHFADWHPDFDPNGRAPITAMRGLVIEMSQSDVDAACHEVVRDKGPGITDQWVASAAFVAAVEQRLGPTSAVSKAKLGSIVASFLTNAGYVYMGNERHRVGPDRVQSRIWKRESAGMTRGPRGVRPNPRRRST
ncbi:DUF5906 domain-containing protein [Paraburkholderia saeva]|uniref:DUF5906 domain-containing protein n=1 Tax=Paraburkholderia saeva TaxID=2777537 RepID=UPI001E48E487|nr:DUF5906 domain-containing protein [Paraburkholderia saeva]